MSYQYMFSGVATKHTCQQCGEEKSDAILRDIPKSQHNPTDDPTKADPPLLCVACCRTYPGREWMTA